MVGDGNSTLLELILDKPRARLCYNVHLKKFGNQLNSVLDQGEELQLVTIGNHMRGTTFFSGNHLITEELELVFDKLAKQIDGFLHWPFRP